MKWFLKDYHLPENLEILFMLTLGILLQMVDGSPLSLKERWMLVWATELPAEYFSPFVQKFIKTLLSMIVAVRCATTYAYVVSATLVIFCIVKDTAPKLMLLWLLVSGIKSVSMTFLEALTGVYVCSAFGKIRKACIEFFISKALEIIFAAYLWGNVLNIYQEMERKAEQKTLFQPKEQSFFRRGDFSRQRTRSLVDESTLYKTACLNNFEFKDVPQIILQMLRGNEMSQDSLLGPEMMLASVSNMGSCDDLKMSESLGELGFMDLENTQIIGLEEDENLSPQEKALKFLKLTSSDVKRIKMNKSQLDEDIFRIDDKTWQNVMASGTRVNKPKQARAQIFIRDISQQEVGEDTSSGEKLRKKSADFKFGFSFSNLFFNEKQFSFDEEEDEILTVNPEEESGKDDEETVGMFMSNIKEGTVVHRNSLGFAFIRKMKGNAYQQLYKQEFMSVIGPEVFDRATKLPKVTSLTKMDGKQDAKPSASLPDVLKSQSSTGRNLSLEDIKRKRSSLTEKDEPEEPVDGTSVPVEEENFVREKTEEIQEMTETKKNDLVEEKTVVEPPPPVLDSNPKVHPSETEDDISDESKRLKIRFKTSLPLLKLAEETSSFETEDSVSDDSECVVPKTLRIKIKTKISVPSVDRKSPDHRKPSRSRRITIRRVRRMGKATKSPPSPPSDLNYPSKRLNDIIDLKLVKNRQKAPKEEESEDSSNSETSTSSRNSKHRDGKKERQKVNDKQIYFFTELLQKPFVDVLLTYYDLKKRVHVQKKASWTRKRNNDIFQTLKILQMLENESKERKMWKSKVFKMAEIYTRQKNLSKTFLKRESILRKLIYYEILQYNKRNLQKLTSMNKYHWPCSSTNTEYVPSEISFTSKSRSGPNLKTGSPVVEESTNPPGRENTLERKNKTCESDENEEKPHPERKKTRKEADGREKPNMARKPSEVLGSEGESLCSQESDEPISLYYSKAANLASPLLDMKRFIYPDHIHYSYKHVKKKGFDVDISGGFPLLVRESLMTPVKMGAKAKSTPSEFEITRRPMDLSFATTNAFAEWQNNDQTEQTGKKFNGNSSEADLTKSKKTKKPKRPKKNTDKTDSRSSFKNEPKPNDPNLNKLKYLYSAKDLILIEKLVKMHMLLNRNDGRRENDENRRSPVQISSAQLHSNKGRINSTYNPAIFLQENKTRNEKKKIETQEKRTKDMFARLEREALLQSKNVQKSFGPSRT